MGEPKINLPDYLFYKIKTSDNSAELPSGNINIDTALKCENSCWVGDYDQSELEKKTLILNLSHPVKNENLIHTLQENGFEILAPDLFGVMQKLPETTFPLSDVTNYKSIQDRYQAFVSDVAPSPNQSNNEDLLECRAVGDKSRSEILIINDENVEAITADIGVVADLKQLEATISSMRNVGSIFSEDDGYDLTKSKRNAHYRQNKKHQRITELTEHLIVYCDDTTLRALAKSEEFNNVCQNIKSIRISRDNESDAVFDLLNKMPNLQSINIESELKQSSESPKNFSDLKLDKLTTLKAQSLNLDYEKQLIQACRKTIKNLYVILNNDADSRSIARESISSLDNLELLSVEDLSHHCEKDKDAMEIMGWSQSLKRFELSENYFGEGIPHTKNEVTNEDLKDIHIPKNIESIRIKIASKIVREPFVRHIYQHAKNLKHLSLNHGCHYNCEDVEVPESLINSNVSDDKGLVKGMISESFCINPDNGKYGLCQSKIENFHKAEKISVTASKSCNFTMPSPDNARFMDIKINLNPCSIIFEDDASFKKLKHLNIEGCHIYANDLVRLLNSATNLESFMLSSPKDGCILPNKDGEEQLFLNENALKNLKNMNLGLNKYDNDLFDALIKNNIPQKCLLSVFKVDVPKKPTLKLSDLHGRMSHVPDTRVFGKVSKNIQAAENNKKEYNTIYEPSEFFQPPEKYKDAGNFTQRVARIAVCNKPVSVEMKNGEMKINVEPDLMIKSQCVQCETKFTTSDEILAKHKEPDSEYFKVDINAYFEKGDNEGVPLPSMSPDDKITHICLQLDGKKLNKDDFSVMYNEGTDQYVLFCNNKKYESKNIKVSFLMNVGKEKLDNLDISPFMHSIDNISNIKSEKLKDMIKHVIDFKDKEIEEIETIGKSKDGYVTDEYFNHIWKEQKGVCRHRAAVLHYKISSLGDREYKSRIVRSNDHEICEIKEGANGKWARFDLGGGLPRFTERAHRKYIQKKEVELDAKKSEIDAKILEIANKAKEFQKERKREADIGFGDFDVWKKNTVESPDELMKKLMSTSHIDGGSKSQKSSLVMCQSEMQLNCVADHICESLARKQIIDKSDVEFCFIDSPDDLRFALATKAKDNNEILVQDASQSDFYKFVSGKSDDKTNNEKVLLIDFSKFSAGDIVKCNGILDNPPQLEGKKLDGIKIIGLHNISSPSAYMGEDFLSRFKEKIHVGRNAKFNQSLTDELTGIEKIPSDHFAIDCKQSPNWQIDMIGLCKLNGNTAVWEEGSLIKALNSGKNIVIFNPPTDNKELEKIRRFLHDLQIKRGLQVHQRNFKFNKKAKIYFAKSEKKADINDIRSVAIFNPRKPTEEDICINGSNFKQLNQICSIDENGKAITETGFIEKYAKKTLPICISSPLSNSQWEDMIELATKFQTKLNITVAKHIETPFELSENEVYNHENNAPCSTVIETDDAGFTLCQMTEKPDETIFIDASEIKNDNLICSVKNKTSFNKNGCEFKFSVSNGVITDALINGKKICVYGEINEKLMNNISSVLANGTINVNGVATKVTGKLTIVTEKCKDIHCDKAQTVTPQDKIALLKKMHGNMAGKVTEENAKQYGFNALNTFVKSNKKNISQVLEGMNSLDGSDLVEKTGLDLTSEESRNKVNLKYEEFRKKVEEFEKNRAKSITDVLETNPCAFVVGRAGSGKTTFLQGKFKETADVFSGEESILDWLKMDRGGRDGTGKKFAVLHIDEGNIGNRDYSFLNGLAVGGKIIVDGVVYQLHDHHRLVFTGNPNDYSKSRKTPAIVLNHGECVRFKEITPESLYVNVMCPIFQPFVDELDMKFWLKTSLSVLNAFQSINSLSSHTAILTPRALQAICHQLRRLKDEKILTCDQSEFSNEEMHRTILNSTEFAVPEEYQNKLKDVLNKEFGVMSKDVEIPKERMAALNARGFYVSNSNRELVVAMLGAIKVRDWKINAPLAQLKDMSEDLKDEYLQNGEKAQALKSLKNKAMRESGGTAGLIIEGESGLGKSTSIRESLEVEGFTELNLEEFDMKRNDEISDEQRARAFVNVPNQATQERKEEVLHWAFDNGIAALLEEINTIENARLERSLNAYCCGKDISGNPPKRSGFALFATQNSAKKLEGRYQVSEALFSRLNRATIHRHTEEDLQNIIKFSRPDISADKVNICAKQYIAAQRYAAQNGLTPPNQRDLLNVIAKIEQIKPDTKKPSVSVGKHSRFRFACAQVDTRDDESVFSDSDDNNDVGGLHQQSKKGKRDFEYISSESESEQLLSCFKPIRKLFNSLRSRFVGNNKFSPANISAKTNKYKFYPADVSAKTNKSASQKVILVSQSSLNQNQNQSESAIESANADSSQSASESEVKSANVSVPNVKKPKKQASFASRYITEDKNSLQNFKM